MKNLQRLELLKDFVQEAIDRGATSVEQVHQHIADLPFDALEKASLLDDDRFRLRDRQRRSIGMVYDALRRINREIGQLISDQFENLEETQHVREVLNELQAPRRRPAVKKTAAKKQRAAAKRRKPPGD